MIRKIFSVLQTVILLFGLCACGADKADENKTVLKHGEISIELSSDFEEMDASGYDAACSDGELVVGLTRISYTAAANEGIPASLSELAFARLYADKLGLSRGLISDYGDYVYISYSPATGYKTTEVFLRTSYAYFIISFVHSTDGNWTLDKTLSMLGNVYLNED